MNKPARINYIIPLELHNLRLDKALMEHPLIRTRTRAAYLIKHNFVMLDTMPTKASQKVCAGDIFVVDLPAPEDAATIIPSPKPLNIIHEDSDIIILNKPAGLVVHPSVGHRSDTLVHRLVHHTKDLSMGFGEFRPGIVHRLDKDTSGLMVVCKTDVSHEKMALQFKNKSAQRKYWAVVYGNISPLADTIESYIGRHPTHRKKMTSLPPLNGIQKGKRAVTHYKVLQTHPSLFNWVECELETGRTHQIRVHLAGRSFPILQDPLYGSQNTKFKKKMAHVDSSCFPPPRMVLHAHQLSIEHPRTEKKMIFKSNWPDDLEPFIQSLNFFNAL